MTKSDNDTSIAVEIEENELKLIKNMQNTNTEIKSYTLLLTIFGNKKDGYTPKQFLNQSVENAILLIQHQSDDGIITGVVCKNDDTKYEDYENVNEIEEWIYPPCVIGKTSMKAQIFFTVQISYTFPILVKDQLAFI